MGGWVSGWMSGGEWVGVDVWGVGGWVWRVGGGWVGKWVDEWG